MMNTTLRCAISMTLAAAVVIPLTASATNGMFSYGWGTQSKAMAGVAAAMPQDTLVTATNPAGMAFLGDRLDLSVSFFSPSKRGYKANPDFQTMTYPGTSTQVPAGFVVTPGDYESELDWFLIPSFGYNRVLNDRMTVGISMFGNGGMSTKYKDRAVWENFAYAPDQRVAITSQGGFPLYDTTGGVLGAPITDPSITQIDLGNGNVVPVVNGNPNGIFKATSPTGINLEQLFIEVPLTYKLNPNHAVAIAPVFAYQRFKAEGLQPFRQLSVAPDKVTNNGTDTSYGFGVQFGWMGRINERLTLGASYRTRVWMTEFDDYKGLFAEEGDLDIAPLLTLGLSYKAAPNLTLALDWQRIFYGDIKSISNTNAIDPSACGTTGIKPDYCLGGSNGMGFGWDSMNIIKFGARWDYSPQWSFMGGISYASDFAPSDQALFNVLAPATIKWHFTLGATYRHSKADEFSISLAYMPKEEVEGQNSNITGSQTGSIYMEQKEIEIGWTHRF